MITTNPELTRRRKSKMNLKIAKNAISKKGTIKPKENKQVLYSFFWLSSSLMRQFTNFPSETALKQNKSTFRNLTFPLY